MARRRLQPYLRDRLARDLKRYLIDGEVVVASVRQHWMSQIAPIAASIVGLALAIWMDIKAPATQAGDSASQAFWFLWLIALGWLAWRAFNWRRDWFVATDKRFLLFYGFIHRRVAMMPLAKVTDLTFHRSILARIFGYGDFRLESAGQNQALSHIDFIPDADEHYRAICDVLFGESVQDEDDEWPEDEPPSRGGGFDPDPYAAGPGSSDREPFPSGPFADDAGPVRERPTGVRGIPSGSDGTWDGDSIYRSEDLLKSSRLEDTGEIPVVVARPEHSTVRVRRKRY